MSMIKKSNAYTVDDITAGLENVAIKNDKKKKKGSLKISEDIAMQGDSKKIAKSKNEVLKEKRRKRNTRSQLRFD
jgi:hypothetical protein